MSDQGVQDKGYDSLGLSDSDFTDVSQLSDAGSEYWLLDRLKEVEDTSTGTGEGSTKQSSESEIVTFTLNYVPDHPEPMVRLTVPTYYFKAPMTVRTHRMANGALGPFIIGIAGGSASGKTSVCKTIMDQLGENSLSADKRKVACIVQDNFYRRLTPAEGDLAAAGTFNFDHPNALDLPFMQQVLDDLVHNRETKVPVYDFTTNSPKSDEFELIFPADVVLVEGILAFYFQEIRDLCNLKIFVDEDADIRLCRRIQRDVEERGRDIDQILNQYMATVKPAFEDFCQPTKKYADVIIPHGEENHVAINLIVQHIKEVLAARIGQGQSTYTDGRAPRFLTGTSRSGLH